MKKIAILIMLFATAVCAGEYTGSCAPMLGITATINGVETHTATEPTFWKTFCPTAEELQKGVQRYLEATGQTARPYIIIVNEHGSYVLHFTD